MEDASRSILRTAADQTKAALLSTESHVDLAIAGVAATMLRLGADRERSGLSIFHTQGALEDAVNLASKMIDARAELGRFHNRMAATARMAGLKDVAIGPTEKPHDAIVLPSMSATAMSATATAPQAVAAETSGL
jgi:hypothetical protein